MKQYIDIKEIRHFEKCNTLNDILKYHFIKSVLYEKALETEKKN